MISIRRFLPAIASTPRRAAISAVLIAGLAAGPLAGHTGTHTATPTANPVLAAVIDTTSDPAQAATPSQADLMPSGAPTAQSYLGLSADQVNNAQAIITATKEMNLPPRAAVIGVATSLQETKLTNFGNLGGANDHDSLGLFQQRPSTGWGTPDQLTNPDYATKAFLGALVQIPGWQTMPLTDAAQSVQVSAFGGAYAQWEQQAANLVHDNWNT